MSSPSTSNSSTGACMCGKITYKLESPSMMNLICHCGHCKRITGSSFLTASIFPRKDLTITSGESLLKAYVITNTDSGKPLTRKFCSECGSYLFAISAMSEDTFSVAAGTLDNVAEWKPGMELYHRDRAAWVPQLEVLNKHVTHPWSDAPEGVPN